MLIPNRYLLNVLFGELDFNAGTAEWWASSVRLMVSLYSADSADGEFKSS
jgi:hypothetical protein